MERKWMDGRQGRTHKRAGIEVGNKEERRK